MNIHFITGGDIYSYNYMKFVQENFDESENRFFVYRNNSNPNSFYFDKYSNVRYYDSIISFIVVNYVNVFRADRIVIHQLNIPLIMLFWLIFYPFIFKKLVWIIWGGDLYDYYQNKLSVKDKVIEAVRRIFIKRIKFIGSYVKGDYDLCKKLYSTSAKYYKVAYPNTINEKVFELERNQKNRSSTLRILVGNSADRSNYHIEILNELSKFKSEDVKIYLPLSYGGDAKYIGEVIEHSKSIFGMKVEFLVNYMKYNEYINLINDMDICVFNHDRQQGLGNLVLMICLRKKVFISSLTTPYKHYIDSGIKVFDTKRIASMSFVEFKNIEDIILEKNRLLILDELSELNVLKNWDLILNQNL